MNIVISIDTEPAITLQELESYACLSTIIFTLTVDKALQDKIQRITKYMPFLSKYPTITTQLKVEAVQSVPIPAYPTVALGGTFDYLHIGHQILLLYSVLAAKSTVYIGVTGDGLLINKKSKQVLQPLSVRMSQVQRFVKSINPQLEYIIFELNDPFGPTITLEAIDCLVASPETGSSIQRINQERLKLKLKPLELVVCPLLSQEKKLSCKISSSAIREVYLRKNNFSSETLLEYRRHFWTLISSIDQYCGSEKGDRKLAEHWWNIILTSYSQHWRHYHTNQHIFCLLKRWTLLKARGELSAKERISVEMALFFHDIVYVTTSKTNEQDSTLVSTRFITEYLKECKQKDFFIETVNLLILETANHVPSTKLSQLVYDLDMGILNTEQHSEYKLYARNIRNQFQPIFKDAYPQKRIEFLTTTLKEKLFFSFEAENLRENLEWELHCLENDDL